MIRPKRYRKCTGESADSGHRQEQSDGYSPKGWRNNEWKNYTTSLVYSWTALLIAGMSLFGAVHHLLNINQSSALVDFVIVVGGVGISLVAFQIFVWLRTELSIYKARRHG